MLFAFQDIPRFGKNILATTYSKKTLYADKCNFSEPYQSIYQKKAQESQILNVTFICYHFKLILNLTPVQCVNHML